ncbi:Galactose-proton symport, partial [Pleurostoma richardsiae]
MAPLKPHWPQPSHPEIQQVLVNEAAFTTKSISKVALPPFGFFAKMSFPPCTLADGPTYATVQMGRDKHLNLNSDLLYINHSCEPSLIFDTANLNIIAGPRGLQPGEELTFFYPSTEWAMAQPFDCLCGTPTCRGRIAGARDMPRAQLDGVWLNGHIRELLDERDGRPSSPAAAASVPADDPTAQALRDALLHAEKVVEAARAALVSYARAAGGRNGGYGHAVGPPDGAAVAA